MAETRVSTYKSIKARGEGFVDNIIDSKYLLKCGIIGMALGRMLDLYLMAQVIQRGPITSTEGCHTIQSALIKSMEGCHTLQIPKGIQKFLIRRTRRK